MNGQARAANEATGSYDAFVCSCEGRTGTALEQCRASLATLSGTSLGCPQNATPRDRLSGTGTPPADVLAAIEARPTGLAGDGLSFSGRRVTPPRATLLQPAHFRAITQPGCAAANSLYYQCARASQLTSSGHGAPGGSCLRGLPSEYSNPEAWLR